MFAQAMTETQPNSAREGVGETSGAAQPTRADDAHLILRLPDEAVEAHMDDLPAEVSPSDEPAQNGDQDAELLAQIALLLLAQDGDQDAYNELQALLEPGVRRFVRRITGGSAEEDDLVQDVFIKFYLNLNRIDPPEKFRAYLYRIARNRCYDEFRAGGRAGRSGRDDLSLDDEPVQMWVSFTTASETPAPDDVTHWLLLELEVREAMDRLPKVQRDALIMYAEENLSYAEIAEAMDCSIGTVKSRLFHAKRSLRGLMRPETLAALDEISE